MQVDAALKTAGSVTEVLDATLPVLQAQSLDAPPRLLGELPPQLEHFAAELPPTPERQRAAAAPVAVSAA